MNHLTDAALNDLLDGSGDPAGLDHAAGCPDCRRRLDALRRIDAALRTLSPDRAPAHFTAVTMERIGRAQHPSFAWSVLRNVAPLLAMASVVTVLVLVGESAAPSTATPVAAAIRSWIAQAGAWLAPYLAGLNLGLTAAALLVAVGLFDRYVLMPLRRR